MCLHASNCCKGAVASLYREGGITGIMFDFQTGRRVWMGAGGGGGGTNVSCQLKFWPFVSCQLNFGPLLTMHLNYFFLTQIG